MSEGERDVVEIADVFVHAVDLTGDGKADLVNSGTLGRGRTMVLENRTTPSKKRGP